MTVSATTTRVSYTGNAVSTAFTITFAFYAGTDVLVLLGNTPQGSGYTITGGGGGTGTCTFASAPANGVAITFILNVPLTQLTSFVDGTAFPSATVNQVNDRAIQASLRLQDEISRTLRAPDGDVNPNLLLPPASQRANTFQIFDSSGNISTAVTLPSGTLSQATIGAFLYPQTPAELAASVTPTNYFYSGGHVGQIFDIRRYGASPAASAAINSTAIQAAVNSAYAAGGGYVYIPSGTYNIDTPITCWDTVSMIGDGKTSSILHKSTATASPVTDPTVRRWDSATVGFPICGVHFVAKNGTGVWAYAEARDFSVSADTASPNTTTTVYGFFFRGMAGCKVKDLFASFTQVGFFWANGSVITSEISGNLAGNTQRGFYIDFITSTSYHHNYANKFRFAGHYLSWYYSEIYANAADNVASPWKVGTTEISLAYEGNGCKGGAFFGNGIEVHNGSCYKFTNCISTAFTNNLALAITSNYTGGSDICLWENSSNNGCTYTDNRMQTDSVTGTGARHFIYKITTELGFATWARNKFVAVISDTTNTSTWANISGTIQEEYEEGSQAVTTAGDITGNPGGTVVWTRYRNQVTLYYPTISGASSSVTMKVSGLPASITPARQQRFTARVEDNTAVKDGTVFVNTDGTLTFFQGETEAAFTNAGTKAVFFQTISYILT